ncbi:hypothetical protein CAPTEDRAFT_185066, partial [Capitella teleta]
NKELFEEYMLAYCLAVNDVLNCQYKRYFNMELTEELLDQTRSAHSHNMDAEEIMGMITAAQDRAPNASMCFVSSKICAQKNQTMRYLEDRPDLHCLIMKSVKLGRCHRQRKKLRQLDLQVEIVQPRMQHGTQMPGRLWKGGFGITSLRPFKSCIRA